MDCGGNCQGCGLGQQCNSSTDCASLVCNQHDKRCTPQCNVETAVDLGTPGTETVVRNDGCVKVHTGYPSWWGTRTMNLANGGGGPYPIPFVWKHICPDSTSASGGTITADWEAHLLEPISSACPTVIDLRGDGSSNISLRYYGL